MVFDLLAEGDEALLETPLAERRARLAKLAERAGLTLTELTTDAERAEHWLRTARRGRWPSSSTRRTCLGNARGWRR